MRPSPARARYGSPTSCLPFLAFWRLSRSWGSLIIVPAAEVSAGHCHITCRATRKQIGCHLMADVLGLVQHAARTATKRHSPVGCDYCPAQPKYFRSGSISADRRRTARLKRAEQAAFCRCRSPADRIIDSAEQRNEIFPTRGALNRQGALARSWQHVVGIENLSYGVEPADPGQARVTEHNCIEFAGGHLAKTGTGVAANRDRAQVRPYGEQLCGTARRTCTDSGARWQVGELGAVAGCQRVARVVAGRHGCQHDAVSVSRRQVFE